MNTLYNFYMNLAKQLGLKWEYQQLEPALEGQPKTFETVMNAWFSRGRELDINGKVMEVDLDMPRLIRSISYLYKNLPAKTNIFYLNDACNKIKTYFPEMGKGSDWDWVPFVQYTGKMLYNLFPRYGNCKSFAWNFLNYVRTEYSGNADVDLVWDFVNLKNKYRFTGELDYKELCLLSDVRIYAEDMQRKRCCYY